MGLTVNGFEAGHPWADACFWGSCEAYAAQTQTSTKPKDSFGYNISTIRTSTPVSICTLVAFANPFMRIRTARTCQPYLNVHMFSWKSGALLRQTDKHDRSRQKKWDLFDGTKRKKMQTQMHNTLGLLRGYTLHTHSIALILLPQQPWHRWHHLSLANGEHSKKNDH